MQELTDATGGVDYGIDIPEPNLILRMGDVTFHFSCKRTIGNRVKYWMFCKFFPLTIDEWK